MPLNSADAIRAEQHKLQVLTRSLEAQTGASKEWLIAAWRTLLARIEACEIAEAQLWDEEGGRAYWLSVRVEENLARIDPDFALERLRESHPINPAWSDLDAHWGVSTPDKAEVVETSVDVPVPAGDDLAAWERLLPTVHDPETVPDLPNGENQPDWLRRMRDDFGRPFHIISTGRTGAPVGRPRRGTKNPETAVQQLLAECPGRTIDELRRVASARGRPSATVRQLRAELAGAVFRIREGRKATNEALAVALKCDTRQVHRLRDVGAA